MNKRAIIPSLPRPPNLRQIIANKAPRNCARLNPAIQPKRKTRPLHFKKGFSTPNGCGTNPVFLHQSTTSTGVSNGSEDKEKKMQASWRDERDITE